MFSKRHIACIPPNHEKHRDRMQLCHIAKDVTASSSIDRYIKTEAWLEHAGGQSEH
jgi:hypothetical protein